MDLAWLTKQNPKFTELRPHQTQAISEILAAYERTNIVVCEAPTGSGKTVLAEVVRQELHLRGLFLCSTIQLQQQFADDFPYASVLKGRRNYTPEYINPARNWNKISCEDCNGTPPSKSNCTLCEKRGTCPYEIEKAKAYRSKVAVLNTSYFLHEANGVDKGIGRSRGFVVVDEADLLEQELLGYVEFRISDAMIRDFRLQPPKKGSHKSTITAWLEELAGQVNWWLQCHELPVGEEAARDVNGLRKYKRNEKLQDSLARVLSGDLDDNWVRDNEAGPLVLKPVHVKDWTANMLWRHSRQILTQDENGRCALDDTNPGWEYRPDMGWSYTDEGNIEVPGKWLLMSGTIIAPDLYMKALGKQPGEYEFVSVASTFPVENRPIYMTNAADMTLKGGQGDVGGGWEKAVRALDHIIESHPNERILVHTVSYKLASYLGEHNSHQARTRAYLSTETKADTLEWYTKTPSAVLIAASMDRGVDFAGDLCTVCVVAKLPYPYLGDPQTNARMRSKEEGLGQTWYTLETGRTLVQMTGRGVRSETDKCITYILDASAPQFLKQTFATPVWWRAGIDRTFNAAKWRREVGS